MELFKSFLRISYISTMYSANIDLFLHFQFRCFSFLSLSILLLVDLSVHCSIKLVTMKFQILWGKHSVIHIYLSGLFPISQFFTSGGQSMGVSASASVLPMNIQDRFPLGWTGWISLQSKGLSRVFSNTIVQKHQFFSAQSSLWSNSHIHT